MSRLRLDNKVQAKTIIRGHLGNPLTRDVASANLLEDACAHPLGSVPSVNEEGRVARTTVKDDTKLSIT